MRHLYILALGALALAASCGEQRDSGSVKPGGDLSPDVVAVVGNEKITEHDLESELAGLPYRQRKLYGSSPERMSKFLESVINSKVLYNEALSRGLADDKEILKKTAEYKEKLIRHAIGEQIMREINENEDGMRRYYEDNAGAFEEIKASSVLIPWKGGDETSKKEASISAVRVEEKAGEGKSLQSAAQELGIEYENAHTETVTRESYPAQITERIFALGEGGVSGPLEVGNGYLIIKVEEKTGAPPFEKISKNTRARLANMMLADYVSSLRERQGVTVYNNPGQENL